MINQLFFIFIWNLVKDVSKNTNELYSVHMVNCSLVDCTVVSDTNYYVSRLNNNTYLIPRFNSMLFLTDDNITYIKNNNVFLYYNYVSMKIEKTDVSSILSNDEIKILYTLSTI